MILNSEEAIAELYNRRGATYSSRPLDAVTSAFFSEKSTAFTPYGKMHRYARALIGETFGPAPSTSALVSSYIEREALSLVRTIKDTSHLPGFDLGEALGRASISTIWAMIFAGERIPEEKVPSICTALRGFSKVAGIGSRIVSLFPFLSYFGIQDRDIEAAKKARERLIALIAPRYLLALDRVRKERSIEKGELQAAELDKVEPESHARRVAEAQLAGEIDQERAIWLIVGLLSASIDTTGSTLHFTLSFIADSPQVQQKAYKLLSSVCGSAPPSFKSTGLEYIKAVVKESTRMWPVSPTGMPRMTDKDDVYQGYFIPKGTTVLMNIRYIQLLEERYDEAKDFKPERWLREGESLNLMDGVKPFGTGRRLCPGIYVAQDVMYMILAHVLWAFEVRHRDEEERRREGKVTVDDPGFGSVIVGPRDAELVFESRL